jgi:hypothetical protein
METATKEWIVAVGAPSFAWFAKGGYHYRRRDRLIVLSFPYPTLVAKGATRMGHPACPRISPALAEPGAPSYANYFALTPYLGRMTIGRFAAAVSAVPCRLATSSPRSEQRLKYPLRGYL